MFGVCSSVASQYAGVFARDGYLPDRRDGCSANERPEVQQPFFAEEADVQVDAVERAERADRIRPSFRTRGVHTVSGAW